MFEAIESRGLHSPENHRSTCRSMAAPLDRAHGVDGAILDIRNGRVQSRGVP